MSKTSAGAYLLAPEDVADAAWRPFGLIDLDRCDWRAELAVLPPFPLLGLGDAGHPLAATLDAVIETPVSVESVARQILQAPLAAAAAVAFLRATDGLGVAAALSLESLCYGMLQGSAEHVAWRGRAPRKRLAEGAVGMAREGDVLAVTLDRPWAHNAIDRTMRDRLFEAFTLAALDTEIFTVRLRGRGAAFSVGADLAEFGTTCDPATAHLIRARSLPALALARRPGILDVHVQGACVGAGLEMAAFAGRLTASPRAWFQLPELAMGLIPGAGGCVSVPRRIGRQRAALMLLSGRRIDAATAHRWGLVDAIMDESPVDDRGAHMAG